jgi:predicted MPP superfamily phosphohydrolase
MLQGIGAFGMGVFGLGGYAFGIEPMRHVVTRYAFTPEGWPQGFHLRIAALSDIHACRPWMTPERIRTIAEATNALKPDLVVLLGDFVVAQRFITGLVADSEWAQALSVLSAPLGVHAVLGNHDWWIDADAQRRRGGPTAARRALEAKSIPVYENDVVKLRKGDNDVWIAGLADQIAIRLGPRRFRGLDDVRRTLGKISNDAPVIALAHEPDIFARLPKRVTLTLCGHTHGGQVRILGYSPIVPSRYGNRYAYGHVVEGGRHLVVSGGLGCSKLPVRFGVPPEIVLIDLGGPAA